MRRSQGAELRLQADLRELVRHPLPLVSARPLEDDLFTWHCNLMGPENTPYAGGLFHFVLSFPKNYPNKPPSARVLSPIPHPHVHGDLVCLDLLSDYASYFLSVDSGEKVLGTGWSSAYSVQTILLQMQAFLMELGAENDDDDGPYKDESNSVGLEYYLRRIPRAIQKALAFSCPTCPHVPGCPWPPVVTTLEINRQPKTEVDIIREELVCFHSRRHFTEDVLGIDISLIWHKRKNEPLEINTNFDLLSYSAFVAENVRHTVMGDEFTHWLPLYVNEEHGSRAEDLLKKSLSSICTGYEDRFRPEIAFDTLAKLCNTMVVSLMSNRTHASLKALSGYCAFQRLLIHFAQQYPSIVKSVNTMVDMFIENEAHRTKDVVKALGEFLPLLIITQKSWKDVALAYLQESFDRNARWVLQKYPIFATTQANPEIDEKRHTLTFESSIVSLRLLLFHVYFLENVARPEGRTLEDIAQSYDVMYGMPSAKMKESLQEACKQIQQVSSWEEYFARIGVPTPSKEELIEWLRRSVANSARKGYHDPRKFRRWLGEKESIYASLSCSTSSLDVRSGGRGQTNLRESIPSSTTRRGDRHRSRSQSPDFQHHGNGNGERMRRGPDRQNPRAKIDPLTIGDRRRSSIDRQTPRNSDSSNESTGMRGTMGRGRSAEDDKRTRRERYPRYSKDAVNSTSWREEKSPSDSAVQTRDSYRGANAPRSAQQGRSRNAPSQAQRSGIVSGYQAQREPALRPGFGRGGRSPLTQLPRTNAAAPAMAYASYSAAAAGAGRGSVLPVVAADAAAVPPPSSVLAYERGGTTYYAYSTATTAPPPPMAVPGHDTRSPPRADVTPVAGLSAWPRLQQP